MEKEIKIITDVIIKMIGGIFTIVGVILLIKGIYVEGLLAIIAGELIDMPQRIHRENQKEL